MNLLCKLGLHSWSYNSKFLPNIQAPIVLEYIAIIFCLHCGKVKRHTHLIWDGKDMVEFKNELTKEDSQNG